MKASRVTAWGVRKKVMVRLMNDTLFLPYIFGGHEGTHGYMIVHVLSPFLVWLG